MSFLPHGGFSITTSESTYCHTQGISDYTLQEIIRLLKNESASKKPDSETAKLDDSTIRSISIFTPPGGLKTKK
jgi:hypothetical protein